MAVESTNLILLFNPTLYFGIFFLFEKEKQTQDFVPRPCVPPTHNDLVCCCHLVLGTYADFGQPQGLSLRLSLKQCRLVRLALQAVPSSYQLVCSRCASALGSLRFWVCRSRLLNSFVSALPTSDNRKGLSLRKKPHTQPKSPHNSNAPSSEFGKS